MLRHMKLKSLGQLASVSSTISVSSFSSSSSSESVSSTEERAAGKTVHGFSFHSDSFSESISPGMKRTRVSDETSIGESSSYCSLITIPTVVNVVPPCTQHIAKKRKTKHTGVSSQSTAVLLLGTKEDDDNLNPIHCFVRRNIEVFVATEEDTSAPCPGRKIALMAGQVGLRCVHCRNVEHQGRAKRAVCYPSSINRVYNCVSDMKFDHFSNCAFLPTEERETFGKLKADKAVNSRRKGGNNTARYYYESARKIGLTENQDGVVYLCMESKTNVLSLMPTTSRHNPVQVIPVARNSTIDMIATIRHDRRPLNTPEDEQVLNPIHCFVRKNVEVFIADENDVAAPAPGRKKPITLGQVGIRCIHCKNLAPKYRVKRAICYPPTVASLYHAVSNMKFDHFPACNGLSPAGRQQFTELKNASKGRGNRASVSVSCTSSYYENSARKELGLEDTDTGIRVANGRFFNIHDRTSVIVPSLPIPSRSTAIQVHGNPLQLHSSKGSPMDGLSALMLAATDSSIREQYERSKFSTVVSSCYDQI